MFVPEFRKAAMESADAYLRYLKEHDKGISKLSVRSASVAEPYVRLYLHAALPHSVELNYFFISFYGDRFPLSRFSPKDYDEKARCILLTPAKDQLQFFSTPPQHIHIISDFRFLVSRVLNWYGLYGTKLRIPREPPSIPPLPLENCPAASPSKEQYAAYHGVMTTPFSYVWGAPRHRQNGLRPVQLRLILSSPGKAHFARCAYQQCSGTDAPGDPPNP